MAILEVSSLKKSFGKTEVLKGVSFSLEQGQVMSIIGSSGSGKTTLLRCINYLETADEGKITVDSEVIFDSSDKEKSQSQKKVEKKLSRALFLNRFRFFHSKKIADTLKAQEMKDKQLKIGLVFQQFNLFPQYDVLDNVTLAVKLKAKERPDFKKNKKLIYEEIEQKALKLLDDMGLSDKIHNYPCELSGGQQQRVSIARAMALEPKILFFDEPTSALDPELTGEILKVIRELAQKNMTMVIVTHEMNFAKEVSDYIVFMDDGVIAEEGRAEEVIGNPKTDRLKAFLSKISD